MSVTRKGPPVGEFRGMPIPAYIITDDGRRHNFAKTSLSIEDKDGAVEIEKLKPDECVIAPGLVYTADKR